MCPLKKNRHVSPIHFDAQGYGMLLMEEAARIAQHEHCSKKIAVISGVGTRHYYRKLGCVCAWLLLVWMVFVTVGQVCAGWSVYEQAVGGMPG